MLQEIFKLAIGEFQVKSLIKYHYNNVSKILVDSKIEKEKYNSNNVFIDKLYFEKNIKNNDIHSIAFFTPYKMEFNDKPIIVINDINKGEIGTIIRSMISFNFFNLAILSSSIDIFDKKIIRASEGSFFQCNIVSFTSIESIKNKYKNKLFIFLNEEKYPSLSISNYLYKQYISNL